MIKCEAETDGQCRPGFLCNYKGADGSCKLPDSKKRKPLAVCVGSVLRLLRKQRGISQTVMADRMGVSQGLISRLEKRTTSIRVIERFAAILNVSVAHVISLAEDLKS